MKLLQKASCICALLLISVAANATVVKSNYTIDANATDPGLVIQTADAANNPFTYDVTLGNPVTFDLFDIWTDENSLDKGGFLGLGCGADCDPKSINVDFGFILPETGNSTVDGTTQGSKKLLGVFQGGKLTWNGPADFMFGPLGDGLLQISLSDKTFNKGVFGVKEGEQYGATVKATLSLISNATATAVPEPGIFALFGLALIGVGFAASRRRRGIAPQLSI